MKTSSARWLLIPLLLMTAWLGAQGLHATPFWLDEVWSVYNAGGAHTGPLSPGELWTRNAVENPRNAVGYHLLLAGWGALVGWTPFATRASSLLIGVVAVAWTYRLGRDLFSPLAGIFAAAIMGTSAFYNYYLHELRAYSLSALLAVVIVWAYYRLVSRPGAHWWVDAIFVLAVAGMLYTYYFGIIVVGTLGLYHLLFVPKTRSWWRAPLLTAAGSIVFLPWLGPTLTGLQLSAGDEILHAKAYDPLQLFASLAHFFSNGVILLAGVALAFGIRRKAKTAWFFALVTLALIVLVNERLQIIAEGRERYLLILWPLLAVVCGIGIAQMWRFPGRLFAVSFLAVWVIIGIHTSLGTEFTRDIPGAQPLPWGVVADTLRQEISEEDAVIVHSPHPNWVWEITTSAYYLHDLPARFTLLEALPGESADELRQSELEFIGEAPEIWLGLDKRAAPSAVFPELEQTLGNSYVSCGTTLDLPRMSLTRYIRKPPDLSTDSIVARFGDGIALVYNSPLPEQAEDHLDVRLIWSVGTNVPPYTYSVALHVLDSDGQLVAQADYGLPVEALACRVSRIPLDSLARGEYTLTTAVYRWENGERLPGVLVESGEENDRLALGTFTIAG